uniref:Secreted protein n=1 Tax=Knipowitschia caucasica TaxID=637954 RepID=A0AAV2JTF6_KNICA
MQCLVHLLTIFPAIILAHLLPITCSTMALRYSSFQLHRLTHCLPPPSDIAASIKYAGLLRRPRYIHRGSRRKFIYNSTSLRVIRTHVKLTYITYGPFPLPP